MASGVERELRASRSGKGYDLASEQCARNTLFKNSKEGFEETYLEQLTADKVGYLCENYFRDTINVEDPTTESGDLLEPVILKLLPRDLRDKVKANDLRDAVNEAAAGDKVFAYVDIDELTRLEHRIHPGETYMTGYHSATQKLRNGEDRSVFDPLSQSYAQHEPSRRATRNVCLAATAGKDVEPLLAGTQFEGIDLPDEVYYVPKDNGQWSVLSDETGGRIDLCRYAGEAQAIIDHEEREQATLLPSPPPIVDGTSPEQPVKVRR